MTNTFKCTLQPTAKHLAATIAGIFVGVLKNEKMGITKRRSLPAAFRLTPSLGRMAVQCSMRLASATPREFLDSFLAMRYSFLAQQKQPQFTNLL
ncbi:MAG: hypothetical protein Q7S46_10500 [Gallionella sp.]|nr:hypothetical protein [Gallionella sp.]